jgi:hypothetical protein
MPCLFHPSWFDQCNIKWRVHVMKPVSMGVPNSCHFISPWSQFLPRASCSQTTTVCPYILRHSKLEAKIGADDYKTFPETITMATSDSCALEHTRCGPLTAINSRCWWDDEFHRLSLCLHRNSAGPTTSTYIKAGLSGGRDVRGELYNQPIAAHSPHHLAGERQTGEYSVLVLVTSDVPAVICSRHFDQAWRLWWSVVDCTRHFDQARRLWWSVVDYTRHFDQILPL